MAAGLLKRLLTPRNVVFAVAGLAVAGLAVSWYVRGEQIESLEAQLSACKGQRESLEAANKDLAGRVEEQNRAVERLKSAREDAERRVEEAKRAAREARKAAEREVERLEEVQPSPVSPKASPEEKELSRCRDAEKLLTR